VEARLEELVDTGLEYRHGEPVLVRVVRRGNRVRVGDDARGATLAGRTQVPEEVARRLYEEFVVNVTRRGEVFLPGERFVDRVARASVALHQELLELER
jgi:hypothetical protein